MNKSIIPILATLAITSFKATGRKSGGGNGYEPQSLSGLINAVKVKKRREQTTSLRIYFSMESLPREIVRFSNLESIRLERKVNTFPDYLSGLENLKDIFIRGDYDTVPEVFADMPNLGSIHISGKVENIFTEPVERMIRNGTRVFIGHPIQTTVPDDFIIRNARFLNNLNWYYGVVRYRNGGRSIRAELHYTREKLMLAWENGADLNMISQIAKRDGLGKEFLHQDAISQQDVTEESTNPVSRLIATSASIDLSHDFTDLPRELLSFPNLTSIRIACRSAEQIKPDLIIPDWFSKLDKLESVEIDLMFETKILGLENLPPSVSSLGLRGTSSNQVLDLKILEYLPLEKLSVLGKASIPPRVPVIESLEVIQLTADGSLDVYPKNLGELKGLLDCYFTGRRQNVDRITLTPMDVRRWILQGMNKSIALNMLEDNQRRLNRRRGMKRKNTIRRF